MERLSVTLLALALFLHGWDAHAQNVALGTNVVQWANLGTVNAEAQVGVSRHLSVSVGGRYNNWSMGSAGSEDELLNRKRCVWAGARWWPWNIYSGLYVGLKAQYQEYNRTIFTKPVKEQGDAYGAGLSVGYSLMLSKWCDLEFGVSGWAGMKKYGTFTKGSRGYLIEEGNKFFLLPDDLSVSFFFIF